MRVTEVFLALLLVAFAKSEDKCNSHNNSCNKCIRVSGCSWRTKPDAAQDSSNCFSNANTSVHQEDIYNPTSSVAVVENLPVGAKNRVSPQKAQAHLRLYSPIFVPVKFVSNEDSLVLPHDPNFIVQLTRTQSDAGTVRVEALKCPENPKDFHQTVSLGNTQDHTQALILDVHFHCECPPFSI